MYTGKAKHECSEAAVAGKKDNWNLVHTGFKPIYISQILLRLLSSGEICRAAAPQPTRLTAD